MPRLAVTIIMIVFTGAALAVLIPALKRARRLGDLNAATALTAGMGLLISMPIAVVAFSGGLSEQLNTVGDLIPIFPSWYHRVDQLAKILVVALALALVLRQAIAGRVRVHIAGLLAVSLWGVAALASGFHGEPVISLSSGTLLACLLAATVLPRGRGAGLGAGIAGMLLAIASGLLAILRPDVALLPCQRKCSVIGHLLTGVLPNSNLLGITLAAAIPFVYLGFRGRARYWMMFYLTGMVFMTGTRTAMAAASITVLALLVVRPTLDGQRLKWPLAAIPYLMVGCTLGVWTFLVTHHWATTALTDRGALWGLASHYIGQSPWFGYGPQKWASLFQISQIPATAQRSAHNQLLDLLYASGVVGAALLVSMLAATAAAARGARGGMLIALGTIMTIGATEGAWQVGTFDFMSYTLVALILTGEALSVATSASPGERDAREPEPREQPMAHRRVPQVRPATWPRQRGQPVVPR